MTLGKGLALSAVGAFAGAAVWIALIKASGWNLWVLAPIVGGAAGFGMMRGTQMKGGAPAGFGAAVLTLGAIFGARYFIVSEDVQKRAAVTQEDAFTHLTGEIAADMDRRRIPTLTENGEYTPRVRQKAADAWEAMSDYDREEYMAARQKENLAAIGVLTPIGLLFDFGIFGTVCAVLSAGTAFKTGSRTLESALVEKGLASEDTAAGIAAKMRRQDSGSSAGPRWGLPMAAEDKRPVPRVKLVSVDDAPKAEGGEAKPDEGGEAKREVA